MDQLRWNKVAAGAGFAAVLVAVVSGRWPRWARIALVAGLVAIACGAGVFAYTYLTRPTTLTVAAVDGDAFRLMSAVAARMASTGSPIRLKVFDKGTALDAVKAFSAGEVDLATARVRYRRFVISTNGGDRRQRGGAHRGATGKLHCEHR
jgi:hypothetical protein